MIKNQLTPDSRRSFIIKSLLSGAGLAGLSTAYGQGQKKETKIDLPGEATVVFQGDSITDAGRDRQSQKVNDFRNMGYGYAMLACAELMGGYPQTSWKLYNRGISGHKVPQLDARWDRDCIDLKADVVSILIGVNDYWHRFTHDYKGDAASYEEGFDALLKRTSDSLPGVKFIIGEPFALKEGSAIQKLEDWYPGFYDYQKAAKRVATKHKAAWIPYQQIFDDACKKAPYDYWGPDGVHPSFAGCQLMAQNWLKAFNSLY